MGHLEHIESRGSYVDAVAGLVGDVVDFPDGRNLNSENIDRYLDRFLELYCTYFEQHVTEITELVAKLKENIKKGEIEIAESISWDIYDIVEKEF